MVNLQERDCRLRDSLKNEWQEPKPTAQAQLDPEQRAAHRSGLDQEWAADADSGLESVSE
jgi:hypothetical protein